MSRIAVLVGPDNPPGWCFRANAQGDLPTCTYVDGEWHRSHEHTGPGSDQPGIPAWFGFLFLLALVGGIAITVWKVSTARRMARESGMNETDATTMTLLTDDGFEATYLAANLRQPSPPTPPAPGAHAPTSADRLRQLQELLDQGLITQAEFDERRRAVIEGL